MGFLIRMLLGLALIALGFFLGALYVLFTYFYPVCILMQSVISPNTADRIMDNILTADDRYENEAKAMAKFFYICFRIGYICWKTDYKDFFVDALRNTDRYLKVCRTIEKNAKKKGIVIETEEKKDETGDQ